MDFPGKNTGVVSHVILQGIFPTQGLNPGLLHCRWILYHLSHQGSPFINLPEDKSAFSKDTTILKQIVTFFQTPFTDKKNELRNGDLPEVIPPVSGGSELELLSQDIPL